MAVRALCCVGMSLHLIKLSVGPASLAELIDWQTRRLREKKSVGESLELVHITRQTPKRAEELLHGGSIYWVIGGVVVARQRLLELRPIDRDGVPHCGLVYAPEMIRVKGRPQRPFQGWRYLSGADVPPDLRPGEVDEAMPEAMRRELIKAGLI